MARKSARHRQPLSLQLGTQGTRWGNRSRKLLPRHSNFNNFSMPSRLSLSTTTFITSSRDGSFRLASRFSSSIFSRSRWFSLEVAHSLNPYYQLGHWWPKTSSPIWFHLLPYWLNGERRKHNKYIRKNEAVVFQGIYYHKPRSSACAGLVHTSGRHRSS